MMNKNNLIDEKNNIQNSSKIVALQNSGNIQWSELVKKDRFKDEIVNFKIKSKEIDIDFKSDE